MVGDFIHIFDSNLELRKDIDPSDLPDVGDVLYLSFTVNYQQADNTGINVNNNGEYKIIFTTLSEIPAFQKLGFKISLTNAKVDRANFESGIFYHFLYFIFK